jgi:hypothetical protein
MALKMQNLCTSASICGSSQFPFVAAFDLSEALDFVALLCAVVAWVG